jgi:DNA-damage-inducible protein J
MIRAVYDTASCMVTYDKDLLALENSLGIDETRLPCSPNRATFLRMSKTAIIRARVEPGLKTEVENILSDLGLTVSETVHLLDRQIKLQRGLPFDVRIPNALTRRTLDASRKGKGVKHFGSKKELYADLGL